MSFSDTSQPIKIMKIDIVIKVFHFSPKINNFVEIDNSMTNFRNSLSSKHKGLLKWLSKIYFTYFVFAV